MKNSCFLANPSLGVYPNRLTPTCTCRSSGKAELCARGQQHSSGRHQGYVGTLRGGAADQVSPVEAFLAYCGPHGHSAPPHKCGHLRHRLDGDYDDHSSLDRGSVQYITRARSGRTESDSIVEGDSRERFGL